MQNSGFVLENLLKDKINKLIPSNLPLRHPVNIFCAANQLCMSIFQSEKVTLQDFCDWLRRHPDSIMLSKWLIKQGNGLQLTDYGETPTFYQTLAKFTGCKCFCTKSYDISLVWQSYVYTLQFVGHDSYYGDCNRIQT